MRILRMVLIAGGCAGVLGAMLFTPEFATRYLSGDHSIQPEVIKGINQTRVYLLVLGTVFLLSGIVYARFPKQSNTFISSMSGTICILICVWVVLAFINHLMKLAGMGPGTPNFFPMSEFYGPRLRFAGLPYSLLFLLTFFISFTNKKHFNVSYVWLLGTMLIIFGNLAQGGLEEAFYKPIIAPDYYWEGIYYYEQYYHEAIEISDWREWLGNFNDNQLNLKIHARTHPPFAVLLHYMFIQLSNNNLLIMSALFILLSSLSVVFIFGIVKALGSTKQQCSMIAILFSVVPAYNIYSAISLDGVIVSFSALFLLGMTMIIKRGLTISALVIFTAGLLLVNMHTFLGLFLLGTAGLVAVHQMRVSKKFDMIKVLIIALLFMAAVHISLSHYYEFSQLEAFVTASGFEPTESAFAKPVKYLMTRLENVTMFGIFLSLGIVAVFLRSKKYALNMLDWRDEDNFILIAGLMPLVPFLLLGGLYTGEIARICMFMYPFFFIMVRKLQEPVLRYLLVVTGLQTLVMQTAGGYFW